jgi:thiol-disulfide isomerase/thioredoxin
MRLLLSLALFQLSIFSFGQAPTNSIRFDIDSFNNARIREATGKPFPNFVAANEQDKITNDSLKGKIVLINFWFEGCHPCLAEFGALNELAEKLKGNKDFAFISFTWDNQETIKRVKEQYKLQFKVFYSKECSRLNLNLGYPTTMILDRQGIIKYLVNGGSLDPEKAREFVMNTLLPQIKKEL